VNARGFSVQRLIKTVASKKAYESALISQENFRIGVFGTKVAVRLGSCSLRMRKFYGGETLPEIGVLLVEDERLLDRVVADALRTIGVPCETVSCEEEAVRRLTERRYDLVISDLRIQRGSGVNVLRHARTLYPNLPVIVATAYAADEEVYHALALGVDALLYKPFDIDTLLNTVRALLARRAPTAYAAVQMPADAPREVCWLAVGALATLRAESHTVLGRVARGRDVPQRAHRTA
jgi:CheY-like chemotaxis protein